MEEVAVFDQQVLKGHPMKMFWLEPFIRCGEEDLMKFESFPAEEYMIFWNRICTIILSGDHWSQGLPRV